MGLSRSLEKMKARYINLVPLLSFGALLVYACYAATVVGHWPYYSAPDPKDLPASHLTTPLLSFSALGFVLVLLIPIGYLVFRVLARVRKWQLRDQKGAFVWYAVGAAPWLLDLVLAWASGYSLIVWIMD
jgi:hypothetical protein